MYFMYVVSHLPEKMYVVSHKLNKMKLSLWLITFHSRFCFTCLLHLEVEIPSQHRLFPFFFKKMRKKKKIAPVSFHCVSDLKYEILIQAIFQKFSPSSVSNFPWF